LEHDELFYKNALSTFVAQVSSLSDFHINQQDLPLNHRIKQVRAGWLVRIQMLQDSISNCTNINDKRNNALLKANEIVKDLEGPKLAREYVLIPKEQLET
jgi:hypothetical protein